MPKNSTRAAQIVALLQRVQVQNVTDEGVQSIRRQLRAALPHVPVIIASGFAFDHCDDVVSDAVEAMVMALAKAEGKDYANRENAEAQEEREIQELESNYLLGLLVGAELGSIIGGVQ